MLRRISTKLVLAVLLAVALPFVAFAFFINHQMADRLTRHAVQQTLLGLVKDLAGQLDYLVDECRSDLSIWARAPLVEEALENHVHERSRMQRAIGVEPRGTAPLTWNATAMARWAHGDLAGFGLEHQSRASLSRVLDGYLDEEPVYDLILLVSRDGRLVTSTSQHPDRQDSDGGIPVLSEHFLEYLFAFDYGAEEWFRQACQGHFTLVPHHVSSLRLERERFGIPALDDPAWDFQLGFAAPVRSSADPAEVLGVLYALVSWKHVQDLVSTEVIKDYFRGVVEEGREPTAYAWLWDEGANTILAHPERSLYYRRVSEDLGLPQLTRAVLEDEDGGGLYPEYEFQGERKNAAFQRCKASLAGGFGWVVGVGIDNDDIYSTVSELQTLLLGGTAGVLLLAVFLTLFVARRTTGPIRALHRQVRRVADGDLDARIEIRSRDELGALAEDFNQMTSELKEQRERIVKAEKDAAWREMARQIAHDIKNPLTPISLSLDLLERARRDKAPGSDEILERTMGLMRRQVENLRQIAGEFYEFTGGRKPQPTTIDLVQLLEEVLHLHDAWAVERSVDVHRDGPRVLAWADLAKLRRVLVNLVSNALQAMSEGGELFVSTGVEGGSVVVSIRDTGAGLSSEARAHLFEPFFTTKTEGTGLGLAIAKRTLEEMGGDIELVPGPDGVGTIARVHLPSSEARRA